jgi:hypothetical protein
VVILDGSRPVQTGYRYFVLSRTSRTLAASFFIVIGFITKARIPMVSAFSFETLSLYPVQRMTGMSGSHARGLHNCLNCG